MRTRHVIEAKVEPVLMGWSSGKDSALALQAVLQDPSYRVEALLTTVAEGTERIEMHNVPLGLLERQAASIGLPLEVVCIPQQPPHEIYDERMTDVLMRYRDRGVRRVVFGDVSLEGIREYRERKLSRVGMAGLFPLWRRDPRGLADAFIARGFRAILTSVDPRRIAPAFCGRPFDVSLLNDLPAEADPCGEKGEFHTFVYDGPIFREPVGFVTRGVTERNGFWYCDILPTGQVETAGSDDVPRQSSRTI